MKPLKILVVDDKSTIRLKLVEALSRLGPFQVTQAENGRRAWELIQAEPRDEPFGLVISDLEMPEMTGLELVEHIRNSRQWARIPVIMTTTAQERKTIMALMGLGIQAYMLKPFDDNVLAVKLMQAGVVIP